MSIKSPPPPKKLKTSVVLFPLRANLVWFILAVADGRTVCLFQQWTVPKKTVKLSWNSNKPAGVCRGSTSEPRSPGGGGIFSSSHSWSPQVIQACTCVSAQQPLQSGTPGCLTHGSQDDWHARSTQVWFLSTSTQNKPIPAPIYSWFGSHLVFQRRARWSDRQLEFSRRDIAGSWSQQLSGEWSSAQ